MERTFLKRLKAFQLLPLLIKEAAYHRSFEEEDNYPGYVLYRDGQESGSLGLDNVASK